LRYLTAYKEQLFTVVSTGTWSISMAPGAATGTLLEHRDMLANVDYQGQPVACARFMGGREYEKVCTLAGGSVDQNYGLADVQNIIDTKALAVPQFVAGCGPFPDKKGRIINTGSNTNAAALASLYCALMLDCQLDLLNVSGDIFIEGAFVKNEILCQILAALRAKQRVFLSFDTCGTAKGAATLAGL